MPEQRLVERTHDGAVAVVTLARAKVNALDAELLEQLVEVLDGLAHDPGVGGVVLTGAGRVFSAGVDLRRAADAHAADAERLIGELGRGLEALFGFAKPTVAAVNGAAVAGGCILACACDRRIMAAGARIGASELVVGVPFPVSALEILRHACGANAEDVVLTGRLLDAQEARAVGMVHEVVEPDAVLGRAMAVATELSAMAPLPYAMAKHHLRRPALERMRDDVAMDVEVARGWASEETRRRIRDQLDRMAAR
ncbi:MAG: enoyl-CoA hydratase/isomerase family protein [Acidimicrobiales bacterium]